MTYEETKQYGAHSIMANQKFEIRIAIGGDDERTEVNSILLTI